MAYYTLGQNYPFPSCSYAPVTNQASAQNEMISAIDFLTQEQMTIGATPVVQRIAVEHVPAQNIHQLDNNCIDSNSANDSNSIDAEISINKSRSPAKKRKITNENSDARPKPRPVNAKPPSLPLPLVAMMNRYTIEENMAAILWWKLSKYEVKEIGKNKNVPLRSARQAYVVERFKSRYNRRPPDYKDLIRREKYFDTNKPILGDVESQALLSKIDTETRDRVRNEVSQIEANTMIDPFKLHWKLKIPTPIVRQIVHTIPELVIPRLHYFRRPPYGARSLKPVVVPTITDDAATAENVDKEELQAGPAADTTNLDSGTVTSNGTSEPNLPPLEPQSQPDKEELPTVGDTSSRDDIVAAAITSAILDEPKTTVITATESSDTDDEQSRIRPQRGCRKKKIPIPISTDDSDTDDDEPEVKRRRGRPKKRTYVPDSTDDSESEDDQRPLPKRGRPKKTGLTVANKCKILTAMVKPDIVASPNLGSNGPYWSKKQVSPEERHELLEIWKKTKTMGKKKEPWTYDLRYDYLCKEFMTKFGRRPPSLKTVARMESYQYKDKVDYRHSLVSKTKYKDEKIVDKLRQILTETGGVIGRKILCRQLELSDRTLRRIFIEHPELESQLASPTAKKDYDHYKQWIIDEKARNPNVTKSDLVKIIGIGIQTLYYWMKKDQELADLLGFKPVNVNHGASAAEMVDNIRINFQSLSK